jgi:hypothetical protein
MLSAALAAEEPQGLLLLRWAPRWVAFWVPVLAGVSLLLTVLLPFDLLQPPAQACVPSRELQ